MQPQDVVNKFPLRFSPYNMQRVAQDILNSPYSGATGFSVGGFDVFHSSTGSGSTSDKGTAFWINVSPTQRQIVAMGNHDDTKGMTDVYKINWVATGVRAEQTNTQASGQKILPKNCVKLNSKIYFLTG